MDEPPTAASLSSPAVTIPEQEEPVFDRGRAAWLTLIGGWLTLFCTFGMVTAFAVFQDLYVRSDAATPSEASWIGSIQLFFAIGMGLPAGKLLDMGYFKITHLVGSILYIFSLFMLSLADINHYYQLILSQGFGMGIGSGMLFMPALAIQAHHWRKNRALAMGIVISGTSTGGIVLPIMLNKLVNGSTGFAWGVRAAAFLILGMLAIANLLMTPRHIHKVPSEPPRDDIEKTASPASTLVSQARPSTVMEIMKDVPFQLLTFGFLLVQMGLFFPYFYLQLYTILQGVDTSIAFYSIAIMNASSVFGRTLPNIVADRIGSVNTIIPCVGITGALIFLLLSIRGIGTAIGFAILYGFFSGAFLSLIAPAIASFARHPAEIGTRMGIAYFITAFGALAGGPISGALARTPHGYAWWRPSVFGGVIVLGGTVFAIVARGLQARRKGTQRL